MKSTDPPIVVEQHFELSREAVWKAITEPVQMRQWFFENMKDFKPEVGFETRFVVQVEDRTFTHHWTVTEVIPRQRLTLNWTYDEYPGDSFVTFELMRENHQTRLRLTHEITEGFPASIPEFSRESCLGGWNYFIQQSLKDYLSQTKVGSIRHFYRQ